MAFTDIQTILTVLVVLTAAAVMVYLDCRKKQRGRQRERVKTRDAAGPARSFALFDTAQIEYKSAPKPRAERPLEPHVSTPAVSKQASVAQPSVSQAPVLQPMERETVTVQINSPSQGSPQGFTSLPAFTIDAALWERLVTGMPRNGLLTSGGEKSSTEVAVEKPERSLTVAPGAVDATYQVIRSAPPQTGWPTAMIQQPAFQKLLDSSELFSGLVVSIGVNESDSSMWHSLGLMQSVAGCVAGLLREKDFACRTDYDEFIMACPGEHGAQSQRRLNQISERLWDYQLRGIGTCSILFSWGGVEVHDQPLAEAVESAVDRMRQTKMRHPKRTGSPSGSLGAHRQAV
jgi:hypothetical protein